LYRGSIRKLWENPRRPGGHSPISTPTRPAPNSGDRGIWGRCLAQAGKKPFLRGARERFYGTTRVKFEKWGKGAEKWGVEGISSQIYGLFRGFVGRTPVLRQAGRNCFGKQPPQKRLFFSINRGFWDCFWVIGIRYSIFGIRDLVIGIWEWRGQKSQSWTR
jgi:hypothetical protein